MLKKQFPGSHKPTDSDETEHFSVGVITDIQYADCDDGTNYNQTKRRFYRSSVDKLLSALNYWNGNVQHVLQLGDVIDGRNKNTNKSESSFKQVVDTFRKYDGQIHHVIGNHELYNFSRESLRQKMFYPTVSNENDGIYYDFTVNSHYRFVILDCYEISTIGYDKKGELYNQACRILDNINPNEDWNSCEDMGHLDQRFVAFNGGLTDKQLLWLDGVLEDADTKKQIVIVAGNCYIIKYLSISCY